MTRPQTAITAELMAAALGHIPADLSRHEWARILAAIKAEFPNEIGLDLALKWSATVGDKFDAKAVKATWRSLKPGGGVTGATVLFEAKQRGFDLAEWHRQHDQKTPDQTPEQKRADDARLIRERHETQQRDQAERKAAHDHAAAEAALLCQQGSDTGESAYLARKAALPYGVRFTPDGWLLVPMRDAAGKLWNLQRIAPGKPAGGGPDKLFLKGGRKTGLFHWCGDPAGNPVLLVAEGYATAASVHQATGRPVAVAFDAGNLTPVCKTLRTQYPAALIVICGDDDKATEARTGQNPGRIKATAAALAVGGLAVFPENLPEGGSDFNDMHQAAGGDAVRLVIDHAIDTFEPPAMRPANYGQMPVIGQTFEPPANQKTDQVGQKSHLKKEDAGKCPHPPPDPTRTYGQRPVAEPNLDMGKCPSLEKGPSRAYEPTCGHLPTSDHDPDHPRAFDPFTLDDSGVWFCGADQDGKRKPPEWICNRLDVLAHTRDGDGGGWGYLLAFADPLGHEKQWAMPARMLSADGGEYRSTLLNMGLRIAPGTRPRNLLTQFIQTRTPDEFATCTDRIGWHGRAFVLPRETIAADDAERIVFQSESPIEFTFRSKGTPDQWRDRVGMMCAGNSRLAFAVACAFAGPLLRPAGMESGGFHYRGDSSSGKTTALKAAASVYGGENYLQRWRATDNALEATAAQHCDGLLILDELAQVDAKTAGECAYMLANEAGKARATRTGTPRARQTWRLLFLSAGELGLSDHMAEGMKRTRTGQEVRMADIPADAGAGMGAFENLHGHTGGAAFAKHVTHQAAAVYGAPGRAWLQWCVANADTLKTRIRTASNTLAQTMIPKDSSGQVERVGARFALVGAAGEMATAAGLTGWPVGESERAALACFNAWLAARGGNGNGEVVAMLRQVRRFLETHGEGRFTQWHRAADDHNPKTLNKAGIRRMVNDAGEPIKTNSQHGAEFGDRMPADLGEGVSFEYFILAETFRAEVCQGFDYQAVCRVLLEHGCLMPDKGRAFDCKARLPGMGNSRCYRIPPAIFGLDL